MPVLATKPTAYFVTGDTGLKQTTNMAWKNKFLDAEELAVIIPIPEKVLDDVADGGNYDLWSEIKPEVEEALAIALDNAIFFGINKPSSWPTAIATAAHTVGNTLTRNADTATYVDLAAEINQVMKLVETDGYDVNGFWIKNTMRADLRGLRSADRNFIFMQGIPGLENTVYKGSIFGEKAVASKSGTFESQSGSNQYELICGDWSQGIVGVRQDITWKLLDQAVLQDADGTIVYNLPQQDMVAMRVVARYAFQVPNPINRLNSQEGTSPTSGDRYPFGVLRAAS